MRKNKYILLAIAAVTLAVGCQQDPNVDFGLDVNEPLNVEAVGGVKRVKVSSNDKWIASTEATWLTITPANGNGSAECKLVIDSALKSDSRSCKVYIENLATNDIEEIEIVQDGFDYAIEVEDNSRKIENFKAYGERNFSVRVKTNVDFEVKFPEGVNWLSHKRYTVDLNRGVRPREVVIDFEWDINTKPEERVARVEFEPKESVQMARQDVLEIRQEAASRIEENTRAGDSVALISIQRALQTYTMWDTSIPMEQWRNVELWEDGENAGRVRRVDFYMYDSEEDLPYELRYLTAAEDIYIFGNTNTFMKDLKTGSSITELSQLKTLTIGAHGLESLGSDFANLKNLEYLNLCANNFATVPDVLTKENFPKLRTLILNANQRSVVYDLSNTTRDDLCGFIEEEKFPEDLLKWGLDTLILSVNYLQGELPDFLDDDEVPFYSEEDRIKGDTLPEFLVNRVKKVMPHTKRFSINFNRLTGKLPDWLLYHPSLDIWMPYSLVFPQEGRDQEGRLAGFENEPANLDYYYEHYSFKNRPIEEDDITSSTTNR